MHCAGKIHGERNSFARNGQYFKTYKNSVSMDINHKTQFTLALNCEVLNRQVGHRTNFIDNKNVIETTSESLSREKKNFRLSLTMLVVWLISAHVARTRFSLKQGRIQDFFEGSTLKRPDSDSEEFLSERKR